VDEDIAEILLSLLLVAIDPTTSSELQMEFIIAVDRVCQAVGRGADVISVKVSVQLPSLGLLFIIFN
jgi:hypothetical protein